MTVTLPNLLLLQTLLSSWKYLASFQGLTHFLMLHVLLCATLKGLRTKLGNLSQKIFTHTHAHAHAHARTHTRTRTRKRTRKQAHTHTHTHTQKQCPAIFTQSCQFPFLAEKSYKRCCCNVQDVGGRKLPLDGEGKSQGACSSE